MIAVFGIFGTAYGTHLVIYHYKNGNGLNVPSLMLLIFGGLALVFSVALYISILIQNKKKESQVHHTESIEEKNEESAKEETKPVVNAKPVEKREYEYRPREKASYSSYSSSFFFSHTIHPNFGRIALVVESTSTPTKPHSISIGVFLCRIRLLYTKSTLITCAGIS